MPLLPRREHPDPVPNETTAVAGSFRAEARDIPQRPEASS